MTRTVSTVAAMLAAVIVVVTPSSALAICKGTRADILACESNAATRRRADNERRYQREHQEHIRQHQREIDAVRAIEKGNKAVRKMQK
jgi:hypothetical protein